MKQVVSGYYTPISQGKINLPAMFYTEKGGRIAEHSHWAKEMVDPVTSNHF
jgi:hypothetical protein